MQQFAVLFLVIAVMAFCVVFIEWRIKVRIQKALEKDQPRKVYREATTQKNLAGRIRNILTTAARLNAHYLNEFDMPHVADWIEVNGKYTMNVYSRRFNAALLFTVVIDKEVRITSIPYTTTAPEFDISGKDEKDLRVFLEKAEEFVRTFSSSGGVT